MCGLRFIVGREALVAPVGKECARLDPCCIVGRDKERRDDLLGGMELGERVWQRKEVACALHNLIVRPGRQGVSMYLGRGILQPPELGPYKTPQEWAKGRNEDAKSNKLPSLVIAMAFVREQKEIYVGAVQAEGIERRRSCSLIGMQLTGAMSSCTANPNPCSLGCTRRQRFGLYIPTRCYISLLYCLCSFSSVSNRPLQPPVFVIPSAE